MYFYTLEICIFSRNPVWKCILEQVHPEKGFAHRFCFLSAFDREAMSQADIVLLDLPEFSITRELRMSCKEEANIILCMEQRTAAVFDMDIITELDDIWKHPLTPAEISLRFLKLLKKRKEQEDFWLTKNYLNTVIDSSPSLIWFKDTRGSHEKVNETFCRIVGKTKRQIEGRGHYYIWDIPKEEYEQGEYVCLETEEIVMQKQKLCVFDEKVKTQKGMRQFKTYKAPIFGKEGQVIGTLGVAHDVTDLANIDAELEVLLRSMPFAVFLKNTSSEIINVNAAAEKYFGIKKEDLMGKPYWVRDQMEHFNEIKPGFYEAVYQQGEKEQFFEIYEKDIYDMFHNFVGQMILCKDITEEKNLQRKLFNFANTDALTGLYNRRYFWKKVKRLGKSKKVSLFYVDLDNFKQVNDTYGHSVGDEVLKKVAGILKEAAKEHMVGRIGGDEFLVAFIGPYEKASLEIYAKALISKMQQEFSGRKEFSFLSMSIGICSAEHFRSGQISRMIRESDEALYHVKRGDKAGYYFYEDL